MSDRGINHQDLNFQIFCCVLIFFAALFICSIGYRVFRVLAFPGDELSSQEDGSSRKTSIPISRVNAIRENPFHDFMR